MPLAISVIKKYFEALSSAFSCPGESHRSGLGTRKPAGGGPEGRAARRLLVEKVARGVARAVKGREEGTAARVSVARVRVVAMVYGRDETKKTGGQVNVLRMLLLLLECYT